MLKKFTAILLVLIFVISVTACTNDGDFELSGSVVSNVPTVSNEFDEDDYYSGDTAVSDAVSPSTSESDSSDTDSQTETESKTENTSSAFADGDTNSKSVDTDVNATITLSGSNGTISDTTRGSSGSEVTITSKGTYLVTGSSDGVSIVVNDTTKSGNVYLILNGVTMTNSSTACINVKACDKLIIQVLGNNSLTYTNSSSSATVDGAIYSKDDVTINGSGTLTIDSKLHGIVCNDDLKITGATTTVTSGSIGVKAGDSLRIGGGSLSITAGHDGIQVENSDGTSYFYIESGKVTVNAGYDGIQVSTSSKAFTGNMTFAGGTLDITAGGGSSKSKNSNTSQKGLKCDGDIYIGDVSLTVSSADDAIHSNASVSVTNGTLSLSSSDDGIHADSTLSISGGTVKITKSYEGLEAYIINISGGNTSVVASDDGINAAGGSDSSSDERTPWGSSSSSGTLNISGGYLYVNAGGDGLDSNGSIYVTGGTTIVEGPTDNGNGALDKGDNNSCVASITGGTVLAIGSTGMAVNFDTGSQCSGLVNLSGSAGTTITVNDGSGFSFTTSKSFACVVYSSPDMQKGNSYTVTAGSSSANMDFSSSYYYSNVSSMGGGPGGGMGGGPGNMGGGPGNMGGGPGGRR